MVAQTSPRAPKSLIFDFDGTLADSLPLVIALYEDIMHVSEPLTKAQIEEYRNMPAQKIVSQLRIPYYRLPKLMVRGRALLSEHMDEIQPCNGIPAALLALKTAGCKMFIISSNSPANIQMFLEIHELTVYFERVYGSVSIFGKAAAIHAVMKRERLTRETCLYIGDETRDIEAARKAGVPVVSVAWGYNGEKILKTFNPDRLISRPAQLMKAVEQL